MADKINAVMTYLDSSQNKGSKTITDINPNAGDGAIKNLCVALNGLTNNTLSSLEKIERTDITNAVAKATLNFATITPLTVAQIESALETDEECTWTCTVTNTPASWTTNDLPFFVQTPFIWLSANAFYDGSNRIKMVLFIWRDLGENLPGEIKIQIPETETTQATTLVVPIVES